ncbi:MAG: PVC-type heme-binding CxxCH protein [Chthoniobacter sp.]|uniref:PVC-type heme-binding CxxCH protein n=1 Tax=Chthoniobacter sp. TaxID=2510640 RepID=UPI0032ABD2AE
MRFHPLWLSLLLPSCALLAAELVVQPGDLPRIPATPPEKAAATFTVRPGFHVELMSAEPTIVSPVAMAFDENGRLYVVEMIDYSERREEKLSRIKLLESTKGDGHYDKSTIFADNLPWATAITCWDGGVFVLASPDLIYFKDTKGDGHADVHALVASGFGNLVEKLNVQALPNYLQWGPDQRIHGALGGNGSRIASFAHKSDPPLELRGRDYSFDPRDLHLRAEIGGGQWGMSFDNAGRKFICNNSRHIVQLLYGLNALRPGVTLPPAAVDIAVDGPQAEVFRTSPDEPWRVIRTAWRVSGASKGMVEGGGRPSGYFTGAAGITIYRGDAFPAENLGDAFIADCGSNLIHRKKLTGEVLLTAERAADEKKSEFAASRDNWCRPVFFTNAPDGCLWFCDMYREVIEHPWSLPEPLKSHLDLNSGNDRGRIWRLVPDGANPRPLPKLGNLPSKELVALLAHPNGWHRDTAARLLHQRQDHSVMPDLSDLATSSPSPLGRLTALRVLAGYGEISDALLAKALVDKDAQVRVQAIHTTNTRYADAAVPANVDAALHTLGKDDSGFVRYELAWALGSLRVQDKPGLILQLAQRDATDSWARTALLASTGDQAGELFQASVRPGSTKIDPAFSRELARAIGAHHQPAEVDAVITHAISTTEPADWLAPLAEGLARGGSSLMKADTGKKLQPLIAKATDHLHRNADIHPNDFTILGVTGSADSASIIAASLGNRLPISLATPALEALARLNPPTLGKIFTETWPAIPAEARPAALRLWRTRPLQVPALLDAAAAGVVKVADFSAEDLAALRESKTTEIRARALSLFGPPPSRDEALAAYRPALGMKGDAAKGHATFQARCTLCHRFHAEGNSVGPELDASASAGREKLMGNILEPSREITAGFTMAIVETKSGERVAGVVAAETDGTVALKTPGGLLRNFPRIDVAQIERSTRSLMPDGIEAGLTPQDMADLLEFLSTK